MGVKWIELVFRQRSISQSKLYRDIIKPAGREATIEMPQSWNDHSDDWDVYIGPRLIEDEEVKTLSFGKMHASGHLLACVETAERRAEGWLDRWMVAWGQKGMVLQA